MNNKLRAGLESLGGLGIKTSEDTLLSPGQSGGIERIEGGKSLYLFGADETNEEKLPSIPIKTTEENGKILHEVELFGPIMYYPDYIPLISLLEAAGSDTEFEIRIASRGGSIDIGATLGSIIANTSAKVTCTAVGPIYSIAMFLWSCGHYQRIKEGASFLFHMSSHGAHGNSTIIRDEAQQLINYVCNYLLAVSLKKGHLNPEEMEKIIQRSVDIVISTKNMRDRLAGTPNYLPETFNQGGE